MRSSLVGELMRAVSRFAVVAMVGGLGAGCSSDAMRFSENPFSNPFSSTAQAAADPGMTGSIDRPGRALPVPAGRVQAEPLGRVRTAQLTPAQAARPVAPAPGGWSSEGGTVLTVKPGDTLSAISQRYGVPAPAITSANGISAAQVTAGRRIVIPVYSTAARPARPASSAAPAQPAAPASQPRVVAGTNPKPVSASIPVKSLVAKAPAPKAVAPHSVAAARPAKVVAAEPVRVAARAPDPKRAALLDPKTTGSVEPKTAAARPAKTAADPSVQATNPGQAKPAPAAKAAPAQAKAATSAKAKTEAVAAAGKPAKIVDAQKPPASGKPGPAPAPAQAPQVAKAKEPEATSALQPAAPTAEFRWPARGRVISGFGGVGANEGVNIAVPEGTPVKAAEAGTVAYAGNEVKGYGNLVLIKHDNGYVSAYAHNGDLDVKRGQKVTRGQIIAKAGQTGNVTSPQIHFEIRKGSTPVDPMRHLASN